MFDVGYSHWLLTQAVGGEHYEIGASDSIGTSLRGGTTSAPALQPLADVDRPEERAWAAEWLEVLLSL